MDSLPVLDAAAASRQGRLHAENEDSFLLLDAHDARIRKHRRGALFAVSDGVSAVREGRWAARTTCQRLASFTDSDIPPSAEGLLQLVNEIDWELRGQGHGKAACTLAALWLAGGRAHVIRVGDSEVFRLRHDRLQSVGGGRKESRRLKHYMGMGGQLNEAIEQWSDTFFAGDVFFLTTDGVLDVMEPDDLQEYWWESGGDARLCCERIIGQVERRKGQDDATVVVVDVLGIETRPHPFL